MKQKKIFIGLQLIMAIQLFGQDDPFDLSIEELMNVKIDVSSSTSAELIETPSTVTIIDKETLEKFNFPTIAEALETAAGIEIYQTIIDRNVATSRGILQNFYANKILLMINGVPTWQPIYGDGHLERIDPRDVERIEILKGPASVLYGSNAYTGVINIVLKDIKSNIISASARGGHPLLSGINLALKNSIGDLAFGLSFNHLYEKKNPRRVNSTAGYYYNGDSTYIYNDYYRINNLTIRADYQNSSLMINAFSFGHTFYGEHPSFIGGGGQVVDNSGILANYRLNGKFADVTDFVLNLTHDNFFRTFPLSQDRSNLISLAAARNSINFVTTSALGKNISIDAGIDYEIRTSKGHDTRNGIVDTLVRHNLLNDDPITEWSLFSEINLLFSPMKLVSGIRYTHNELFGSNISSRVSALYQISPKSSLKLIYGQSFRAPTMFELYFNHSSVVGNPDLKPELSSSTELAYLVSSENYFMQILGYYAVYNNLIQRATPVPNSPSVYQNVNTLKSYGIELEIKYLNNELLNWFINFNHLKGLEDQSGNNFRFVPENNFYFGIDKSFSSINVALNGKFISAVNGHLSRIAPQFFSDAHISYRHHFRGIEARHTFSLRNLTGSRMLTPEYIRQRSNINELETMGSERRLLYSLELIL